MKNTQILSFIYVLCELDHSIAVLLTNEFDPQRITFTEQLLRVGHCSPDHHEKQP